MLLALGLNAYVVTGYATPALALADMQGCACDCDGWGPDQERLDEEEEALSADSQDGSDSPQLDPSPCGDEQGPVLNSPGPTDDSACLTWHRHVWVLVKADPTRLVGRNYAQERTGLCLAPTGALCTLYRCGHWALFSRKGLQRPPPICWG